MANVVELGDAGSSNLVQGTGTNSATFTMPKTGPLAVESVVATVDNGAGADTTATLTIRDQSGEVIATKRQGESIPGGDTGTATFALRTADDRGVLRRFSHKRAIYTSIGQSIIKSGIAGSHALHWQYDSGAHILDLVSIDDRNPLLLFPGTLTVTLTAIQNGGIAGGLVNTVMDFNTSLGGFVSRTNPIDAVDASAGYGGCQLTQYVEAGTALDAAAYHNQAVSTMFDFYFYCELDNVS